MTGTLTYDTTYEGLILLFQVQEALDQYIQ